MRYLLYGKAHSHTTLKEGIEPIMSSFESRRSQLSFEGFDTLWYAGQMVSLMDFVHASKYM